jgi:uncharacterized protein (DUF342 family)
MTDNLDLIDVITERDGMLGYIKLNKPEEDAEPIELEDLLAALKDNDITFGIKTDVVEKLANRPIYGIKIEVARGVEPIDGDDGYVNYFVKKSNEYKPEISEEEGRVDFKDLDYFQLVKKGQVLCEIVKETKGTDGTNIYGAPVPAKEGRPPISPKGRNTELSEDGTKLIATCDGSVRFIRDVVDVNEVLRIPSGVDQTTGNINFTGDVIISGDVCYGYSVKSGGNIKVNGVVEGASIEAEGDVFVSQGINGGEGQKIFIAGNLSCRYIEDAEIEILGDIKADYIIGSNIVCHGNIELSGRKGLLVGGSVKIYGDLEAKDIGNQNERHTRIEIIGIEVFDKEAFDKLVKTRDGFRERYENIYKTLNQLDRVVDHDDPEMVGKLDLLKLQRDMMKKQINKIDKEIQELRSKIGYVYNGSVICRRKLYQGVKIYFGETRFRFEFDSLEHCKIYWYEGEIMQGML